MTIIKDLVLSVEPYGIGIFQPVASDSIDTASILLTHVKSSVLLIS